jgi:hypothetical protein
VEEISSVSKALGDTTPKDEAGLIITDKLRDEGLQSVGEDFGQAFDGGVLKGDWSEITRLTGVILFWQEDKVGTVNAFKVSVARIEFTKEVENEGGGRRPGGLKKRRAEAVGAGASIVMHAVDSKLDLC